MADSLIEIILFAPLAPLFGVILFWFIQLLFIESQKYLLSKMRSNHEPLCRFTNFLGVFFQTVCHALGYTVTRSGISSFYVNINYGKVSPKKEKKGIFEWMSNVFLFVGPFFIPSSLLLICIYFIANNCFDISTHAELIDLEYTFAGQMISFGTNLYTFSEGFFGFLFSINLLHPGHFGFMILLIFIGMGIRPSYIGEKKREKVDMIYDLKNIKNNILHKPLYIIVLFLMAYILFYISLLLQQGWYVALFSILGWISIVAIVSMIITHMILFLIDTTDEIPGYWKLAPYIVMIASYVSIRVLFLFFPTDFTNGASLLAMILSTILSVLILLKFKTNKFKTKTSMKSLSKRKIEDETDVPRRIIRE